ncbi:hypothetical protein [Phenylobacterium sp.]|jgi:hypothetical protein|uniref:hypothetical protein n=1 Tax=Phenylobacterium sp. TaxID=1871053 RepID=UPI0037847E7F
MRFIVCAVAAAGLLTACAHNNNDMAAADTGMAAPVSDTAADTAPAPAPEPMPAPEPAPAPTPAPSTGERG